jgi:hypothetical protein
VILTHGEHVVDFVQKLISEKVGFDNPLGMGVMSDNEEMLLGVVLDNYRIESNSICASIAIIDQKVLTKSILRALFHTAFIKIGVERISCMVEHDNYKSNSLTERLGFIQEGVMRKASFNKKDLVVYGMLREDCKWI